MMRNSGCVAGISEYPYVNRDWTSGLSLLGVNNGLSRPTAATSAFGGKADIIFGRLDV